jgi:CRP-like cAMP-binding protein
MSQSTGTSKLGIALACAIVATPTMAGALIESEARSMDRFMEASNTSLAESVSVSPHDAEMMARILDLVTRVPGLDDEEVAERIGITTFHASELLNEMEREGLVTGR